MEAAEAADLQEIQPKQRDHNSSEFTSCEHQSTFAVIAVVVVLVPGAESGPLGGDAALPARRAAVTSQV